MAQKKIYCYAVLYGSHAQTVGIMYVQARNAERAISYARRWFLKSGHPVPHDKMKAIRWEKAVPTGVAVHNETDIPWDEAQSA